MNSQAAEMSDDGTDGYNRKSDVRYSAHCPGIVELIFKDRKHFIALTGVIVNLSVTGCLFSNDKMPWANREGRKPADSLFDVIDEACRIYVPWTGTHCTGRIRRVGSFIIAVQFDEILNENLVKSIASLEPGPTRRLRPKVSQKYNRILPNTRR